MATGAATTFISLKHGACADAVHDFGDYSFNTTREPMKNPGLPEVLHGLFTTGNPEIDGIPGGRTGGKAGNKLRHESEMLEELFNKIGLDNLGKDASGKKDVAFVKTIIERVCETNGDTNNFYQHLFDIETINGTKNYSLQILSKQIKEGAKPERNLKKISSLLTTDEYISFFGTDDLNIVIDCHTIGLFDILSKVKNGTKPLRITSIINREIVNDPAPKTHSMTELRSGRNHEDKDNKLQLIIKYDAYKGDITYTHTTDINLANTEFQRDKLFSILDFRLSPLRMEKNKLPLINLDILNPNGTTIHQSANPHSENEIEDSWARIVNKIKGIAFRKEYISSQFQCKRSGDWLQALSCLDTKRQYTNNGILETVPSMKLVTHDIILLWYALFMGIDVLFTYILRDSSKSKAAVATDKDEDDMGSEKILLLFKNNTETETPRQRYDRKISMAEMYKTRIPGYMRYVQNYNEWVQSIEMKQLAEIQEIFNKWLKKPKMAKYVKLLLQAYWEITSIDYKSIQEYYDSITQAYNAYASDKTESQTKEDKAGTFVSYCFNLEAKMNSIQGIEDLLAVKNSYRNEPDYTNMVSLMTIVKDRDLRLGTVTHEEKAIKTYDYLKERLPVAVLQNLKEKLTIMSNKIKQDNKSKEKYVLDIFLNLFEDTIEPDIINRVITNISAAKINNYTGVAPIEEIEEDIEPLDPEENTAFLQAIEETKNNKRKNNFSTPSIKSIATSIGAILGKAVGIKKGGTLEGGDPSHQKTLLSYILVQGYLYELLYTLSSFEDGENDYIYYDALARLAVSCASSLNDYNSLQAILYDLLPSGVWATADFLKPNFSKNVSMAALHIGLHSLDMRDGPIPVLGNTGSIGPEAIQAYTSLTERIKDKEFRDRKLLLLTELFTLISKPQSDLSAPVPTAPVLTTMHTGTTLGFRDYFSLSRKEMAKALQMRGGDNQSQKVHTRRKRKGLPGRKRKGSPRRRTIKRTRKLR